MIKLVAFVKRKPGLSAEEFYEHWFNVHGPLIVGTPELSRHIVRYEQLKRSDAAPWMGTPGYDGITIQWMESHAAFEAFVSEPKYAELVAPDEARFIDMESIVWMITDEPVVTKPGPTER